MELRHYVALLWKWLWLIVVTTGITTLGSYVASVRAPKYYRASATLLVGQSLENPNPNSGDIFTSQQLAQTYVLIATTDTVLQGVVDKLGLQMSTDDVRGKVNVNIVQGTQVIQISVVDTEPARAQAIANAHAYQLTLQGPAARDPMEASRREFARKQVDEVQRKIQEAQKRIDELQSSIGVTTGAREAADKQNQINTLQGQINQWQITFATLTSFLTPQAANYLSVLDWAKLPTEPVAPNVVSNVAIAAAVGLMLAVAAALVIEYIDDTVKTSEDVAEAMGVACLGNIAFIWGDRPDDKLIAAKHPRASHSEAYRSLRTNIQVATLDKPNKTLLVTSPNPGEGKSITAANLAVVMAQTGQRVVLVDADMRCPYVHNIFDLPNNFGLTNALLQPDTAPDEFLKPTATEGLSVLTTGQLPPNPAELLDSRRMHELIDRLKAHFDVLVFDTPPCLLRTDAAVLARHVDGVLLVVDAGHTRREAAVRAKETMTRAGGRVIGVALNRISHRDTYYYYYFYSDEGRRKKSTPFFYFWLSRFFRQSLGRLGGTRWENPN